MRHVFIIASLLLCLLPAHAEPLRVSALHPLMADLAKQVGGERVQVFDLVKAGGNPHRYEPRPEDLSRMKESTLILASGKGLESYLTRIQATLTHATVLEVGKTMPSLRICSSHHGHGCEHDHGDGSIDPHWWHSIDHMSRASRVIAAAFIAQDPEGKATYEKQARAYRERLKELKQWAKLKLAKVPRGQRKLVTAHNAFGYFANEFGFEVIAIAGLNQEQGTAPKDLAATIEAVREAAVQTIFPEAYMSTRPIESVAKETGSKIGTPLIADGNGSGKAAGFEGMIRHNVTAITQALATP